MRRVHGLSWLLLAILWFQVPGSDSAKGMPNAWEPFLRSARVHRYPVTYIEQVAGTTGMSFGDPGAAVARYRFGTVRLLESFRDADSGALLPMEKLWETPAGVGAVYHELFHAWFEQVFERDAGAMAEFERHAQETFVDVPPEKRLEVAEEAVACWIESLIDSSIGVLRRNAEAATRSWKPVAQWDAQDLRALANGYEVNFLPGAQSFGYYEDGGELMHTRIRLDAWFIGFAWETVLRKELPRTFQEFLARLS